MPSKIIADGSLMFYYYYSEKIIKADISCVNGLLGRSFTWSVKPIFSEKKKKHSLTVYVDCLT